MAPQQKHTVVKPMQELGSFDPFKHIKGYRKEIELNMSYKAVETSKSTTCSSVFKTLDNKK